MQNIVGLLLLGVVGCLASGYNDGYGGGHGFSHGNSYAYNGHYGGKTIYSLLTTIDCYNWLLKNALLFQCICKNAHNLHEIIYGIYLWIQFNLC